MVSTILETSRAAAGSVQPIGCVSIIRWVTTLKIYKFLKETRIGNSLERLGIHLGSCSPVLDKLLSEE